MAGRRISVRMRSQQTTHAYCTKLLGRDLFSRIQNRDRWHESIKSIRLASKKHATKRRVSSLSICYFEFQYWQVISSRSKQGERGKSKTGNGGKKTFLHPGVALQCLCQVMRLRKKKITFRFGTCEVSTQPRQYAFYAFSPRSSRRAEPHACSFTVEESRS